ncbi:MAG TPA: BON domain-containing protein [Pseudomonadales bacterium]|nr:BON domain-containing protein [Pseudomonadales bacterium]
MKLHHILKFTVPTLLLSFAGTSLADQGTKPAAADSHMAKTAKTDTTVNAQVQKKLHDPRLKNANIETDVTDNGSVLIRGTVSNAEQSRIAEQLASSVAGVTHVKNELRVPRGE